MEGNFKDASSESIRDWVGELETSYYLTGTAVGPHPCPSMVREFQSVIGKETRKQSMEKWGGKPDVMVACIGSGSNALGFFHEFIEDEDVRLIGVEAAGFGLDSGKHAATLARGEIGVYHGAMSYLLQDNEGQVLGPHSIGVGLVRIYLHHVNHVFLYLDTSSSNLHIVVHLWPTFLYLFLSRLYCVVLHKTRLEYPGVGPELSFLKDTKRVEFYTATDTEAVNGTFLRVYTLYNI